MNWLPLTPFWYLLFPLNRLLPFLFPNIIATKKVGSHFSHIAVDEYYLSVFIFLVTLVHYLVFAIGTIK
jgi:hypothetical protein